MTKKIVFCGGHLAPAVAILEEMRTRYPDWEYVFVGRTTTFEGSSVEAEEEQLMKKMGIRFVSLRAGRGQMNLSSIIKIPMGFFGALGILRREKPDVVVSCGGYIAFPLALIAWVLRIPVLTHEQTRHLGLANSIIAAIAKRTCVSFLSMKGITAKKSGLVYTGLPIRKEILMPPQKSPFSIKKPFILIAGGTSGSVSINTIVWNMLPELLTNFSIVHIVGKQSFDQAKEVAGDRKNYIPLSYVDAATYSWLLHHAEMVITRAGANTVAEIAAVSQVAIFIPLPWARDNEQMHNAKMLEVAGSARIIEQKNLNGKTLSRLIREIVRRHNDMKKAATLFRSEIPYQTAAERIVSEIVSLAALAV